MQESFERGRKFIGQYKKKATGVETQCNEGLRKRFFKKGRREGPVLHERVLEGGVKNWHKGQ